MPFSVSPGANSPHLSDTYETALAVLANGLSNDVDVNIVLGPPGIGKTTLIENFVKNIQHDCTFSLISSVVCSARELYQLTLEGFGQQVEGSKTQEMEQQLRNFLKDACAKQNQPSLLLIDDADTMSIEALKRASSVADAHDDAGPLVQIVLAGTEGLLDLLKVPELEELSKKVGTLCYLTPLTVEETKSYIRHRLKLTGAVNENLFDDQACSEIYRSSKGVPKAIDSLCDDALLHAKAQNKHQNDTDVAIKGAEKDWQPGTHNYNTQSQRRVGMATFVVGGLLVGAAVAMFFNQDNAPLMRAEEEPPPKPLDADGENLVHEEYQTTKEPNRQISTSIALERDTFGNPVAPTTSLEKATKKKTKTPGVGEEKKQEWPEIQETQNGTERLDTINPDQQDVMPESDVSTEDQEVEMLIALAEKQMANSKFSLPTDDNAYQTYTRILAISPSEERAVSGLRNIANRYLEWAEIQRNNGDLKQSKQLITRGLRVDSGHRELLSLKEQVTSELNIQSNESNFGKVTIRSRQQISPRNTFGLKGHDTPGKSKGPSARGKQDQQAMRPERELPPLKSQLENALEKQDFKMALAYAEQVLATNRSDANDSHWRDTIVTAIDAKQVIRNQIKDLLSQADRQFDARQISRPAGNNAFQSYQKILEIDPNNQRAKRGIERISQYYDTLARTELAEGNREGALTVVNEGLESFPDHLGLRNIRDTLKSQQDTVSTKSDDEDTSPEKQPEETKTKRKFRTSISF